MVAFVAPPKKDSFVGAFLPAAKLREVNERVRNGHFQNRSVYVRELIDHDLSGTPSPSTYNPTILEELAKGYCGWVAPKLAEQLAQQSASQPKLLADLLVKLSEYLAHGYKLADLHMAPHAFVTYAEAPEDLRMVAEPAPTPADLPPPAHNLPPAATEEQIISDTLHAAQRAKDAPPAPPAQKPARPKKAGAEAGL